MNVADYADQSLRMREALAFLNPGMPRDEWVRIGMAIKSELGDSGFSLFDQWSQGGGSYDPENIKTTWNSITGNGKTTGATVYGLARDNGWKPQQNAARVEQDKELSQAAVAKMCAELWRQAAEAALSHPYLVNKGCAAYGIKQESSSLLIPMQDSAGKLWSLQTISPDGSKLFTKGGRAKGMYHSIPGDSPVVICEGYATGASIHEATGYSVAVAFFCGNLESVARTIRNKLPEARIIIAADSAPDSTTEKARTVAQAISAELAIPSVESDFNDLVQAQGLEAVKQQIDAAQSATPEIWGAPNPITPHEWESARLTPDCIVEDYLFADVALQVAPGGTGKTTLNLFEAIHIALGLPLYGLQVHRPGPVVILTAEDSREMLAARLKRIAEAMQLSPAQVEQVRELVRISDVCGAGLRLTDVFQDVVRPSEFVDTLAEGLQRLAPVLVNIDPAVSFGCGESRVNDAEQGLIEAGRRLRRELNCCCRYVHHTGKGNARERTTDQYAGRGGSAFADGARMVHVLQPLDAKDWRKSTGTDLAPGESGLILARPKMSYCQPQGDILLRRNGYHFEHVEASEADPLADLERDAETILEAARELDRPTQNTLAAMDTGLSRDRTRAVIRYLLDDGQMVYRENNHKGGAQQYLQITETSSSRTPSAHLTETATSCADENTAKVGARPYREKESRAPSRGLSPSDTKLSKSPSRAPSAHLAHLDPETWESEL